MENNSEILTQEQWKQVGLAYRPDSMIPEANAKIFLKQDEVKQFADSHLIKALTDLNIDTKWLLTEKKELYEIAKSKKDVKNALAVIHSFENNAGLNNKIKVTQTQQNTQNNQLQENFRQAIGEKQKVSIEYSGQIPANMPNAGENEPNRGDITEDKEQTHT